MEKRCCEGDNVLEVLRQFAIVTEPCEAAQVDLKADLFWDLADDLYDDAGRGGDTLCGERGVLWIC